MKKIKLILSDEQAKIGSKACEFFARIKIGQFDEIVFHTLDHKIECKEYFERRERATKHLLEARKSIYPELYGIGHSYGIGRFEDADKAFDVHQVIRHTMGNEREPFSYYDLPECELINDN